MTNAEINRRLAGMTPADIVQVKDMIAQGYGAQGIKNSTTFTLRQINAVFAANERAK